MESNIRDAVLLCPEFIFHLNIKNLPFPLLGCVRDFHPLDLPMSGAPKKREGGTLSPTIMQYSKPLVYKKRLRRLFQCL